LYCIALRIIAYACENSVVGEDCCLYRGSTTNIIMRTSYKGLYFSIRQWTQPRRPIAIHFQPAVTRKLSYRKDNRAMRPIHGCPEKFRKSLTIR